jgi:hypothetical protein
MSRLPLRRSPTAQQWQFARLIAIGIQATSAYRMTYPPRVQSRNPQTEWSNASRLAHCPAVVWAVERIRAGNWAPPKVERLKQRERAILARRAIARILQERGRRADVILSGRELSGPHPEEQPRKQAWRMFLRACGAVQQAKGALPTFLTPQQKVEMIFARLAPIALPELEPPPPAATAAEEAELDELVRAQRAGRDQPDPSPLEEVPKPKPGHFPQVMPAEAEAVCKLRRSGAASSAPSGRWELVPVAGTFPPRRRRVWVSTEGGD